MKVYLCTCMCVCVVGLGNNRDIFSNDNCIVSDFDIMIILIL